MKAILVSWINQHLSNPFSFFHYNYFKGDDLFLSADSQVTLIKKREAFSKQMNKKELLAYKPSSIKLLMSAGSL